MVYKRYQLWRTEGRWPRIAAVLGMAEREVALYGTLPWLIWSSGGARGGASFNAPGGTQWVGATAEDARTINSVGNMIVRPSCPAIVSRSSALAAAARPLRSRAITVIGGL